MLHLIVRQKMDCSGRHLCFDPQKKSWFHLEAPPSSAKLNIGGSHYKGFGVCAAVGVDKHILTLASERFPGCEEFELDSSMFYMVYDVATDKWTTPRCIAARGHGSNMFLMSSIENQVKIIHADGRPAFNQTDKSKSKLPLQSPAAPPRECRTR